MPRQQLYAYVDGADLETVAAMLEARLTEFVANRQWIAGDVSVINRRHGRDTCMQPGDLPIWDLGITFQLPDPGTESPGWFTDIEAVAQYLGTLHQESGRDFIIGIADTETGIADDLFTVSTNSPDLGRLRIIIGVADV